MQTIVDGSDTTVERLWAMTDANYNVVELIEITNGGATINDLERYTYDAYGTPTVRDLYYNVRTTGTAYDWQHLFTGQRQDLETGLYHYRNRQYHPALGTFVTRDPIGYNGGINLLEYVKGRPTIYQDFDGCGWFGSLLDMVPGVGTFRCWASNPHGSNPGDYAGARPSAEDCRCDRDSAEYGCLKAIDAKAMDFMIKFALPYGLHGVGDIAGIIAGLLGNILLAGLLAADAIALGACVVQKIKAMKNAADAAGKRFCKC